MVSTDMKPNAGPGPGVNWNLSKGYKAVSARGSAERGHLSKCLYHRAHPYVRQPAAKPIGAAMICNDPERATAVHWVGGWGYR